MEFTRFANQHVPHSLQRDILAMVEENLPSLSKQKVDLQSSMYDVVLTTIQQETALYLSWIGDPEFPTELIVAKQQESGDNQLVGFLLYSIPVTGEGAATIHYTAVNHLSRQQGVLRSMMATLVSRNPVVTLCCSIENVPIYERLGFYVTNTQVTNVGMANRPLPPGLQTITVDMVYINKLSPVKDAKQALKSKFGKKVAAEYAKFTAIQRAEEERVVAYVASRLTQPA